MKEADKFEREKRDFLGKKDKSRKKSIDERILPLIKTINESKDYFTTSSCSGRIIILIPKKKKQETKWLFVSHEKISKGLERFMGKNVWFKCEGPILHIRCRDINAAERIVKLFRMIGWKKTGIIGIKPKIMVEAATPFYISFPFQELSKGYIEIIIEKSNNMLEKGWELIEKARKIFKDKDSTRQNDSTH